MSDPRVESDNRIASRHMLRGDRIMVEPSGQEPFPAIVKECHGWGLVNGCMNWKMERDDGSLFIYSIHVDTLVEVTS